MFLSDHVYIGTAIRSIDFLEDADRAGQECFVVQRCS